MPEEYSPGDEVKIKLRGPVDFLHAKVVMKAPKKDWPTGYYVTIHVFPDEMSHA